MNSNSPSPDYSPYYPLWSRQLLSEFDTINWQYGLRLKTPLFAISESRHGYGSWQAATRTISLSVHLIVHFSWDVSCMILKHEIAHQICSERFFADNEGHGPRFQQACDLLGLPPAFRLAAGDLPEGIKIEGSGNLVTEKARLVIRKVGKLLALANSTNEHEAALAMKKAGQLMARHNIQQIQEDKKSEFQSLVIKTGRQRIEGWQNSISMILLRFFFVKVVTSTLYDPLRTSSQKTIRLFGRAENVEIAHYCYQFLSRQIVALWRENRSRLGRNGVRARNSYYLGVLQGFYEQLQQKEEGVGPQNSQGQDDSLPKNSPEAVGGDDKSAGIRALVVAEDQALAQFVGRHCPRLRHRSSRGAMVYQEIYEQGRVEGQRLSMRDGVGGETGSDLTIGHFA
jgi:hypothetical protein